MNNLDKDEMLLQDNPNRFLMRPILYPDIYELYEKHLSSFWVATEVDLTEDIRDWESLTDDERYFLKHVLAFFAASDGIVLENLAKRFASEIQIPEVRAFYSIQQAIEVIHSITYADMLETYVTNAEEQHKLFRAIETIPSVGQKAAWAQKWIESSQSFVQRLVAFACVEGIFFSGSFCSIFWMKTRGKLPGMCFGNELISRDEAMHVDLPTLLYRKYVVHKLSDDVLHSIVREAVEIEEYFITEAIPCKMLGMNADLMKQYIRFVANKLVQDLGHPDLYPGAKNPFPFMDRMSVSIKGNFFERDISDYSKSVHKAVDDSISSLNLNAEF